MDVHPLKMVLIGIDPYPYMFHGFFSLFPIVATGRSTTAWEARPPCAEKKAAGSLKLHRASLWFMA